MEKYRKTVILRCLWLAAAVLAAAAFGVYDVFFASDAVRDSMIFGFQCGLTVGLGLLALIMLIRYSRALKNDVKLRKQYNLEHDERMQAIHAKAGMPMLLYTSCGMVVAAIIAGYNDAVVCMTLIKAAAAQLIVGCTAKLAYTLWMNGEAEK